jgi:hypothetical protein
LLAFPEDFFAFTCVFSICNSNVETRNDMREVSNPKPQHLGPSGALAVGLRAKTGTTQDLPCPFLRLIAQCA